MAQITEKQNNTGLLFQLHGKFRFLRNKKKSDMPDTPRVVSESKINPQSLQSIMDGVMIDGKLFHKSKIVKV
jgi:hypothetical protein